MKLTDVVSFECINSKSVNVISNDIAYSLSENKYFEVASVPDNITVGDKYENGEFIKVEGE